LPKLTHAPLLARQAAPFHFPRWEQSLLTLSLTGHHSPRITVYYGNNKRRA
jgi:hypothetical protein